MKKIFLFISLFSCVLASAQSSNTLRADRYFERTFYSKAIPLYIDALAKNKSPYILKRLADSYYYTGDMENALSYYKILTDRYKDKIDSDYYFRYAHTLLAQGEKAEARKWMQIYADQNNLTETFREEWALLDQVEALGNRFEITNLAINTSFSDFGAFPYGRSIVYTTPTKKTGFLSKSFKWNNQPYLDLYIIEASERIATDSISSGFSEQINTGLHESNAVFTKDGKTVYFTRNSKREDEEKIAHLQIYKAILIDGEWSNIEPLPFNSETYSVEHPALSPDEKYLFFASDMPGSFGSFDIFAVEILKDGTFGKPVNVGPHVNTSKREQFPFISESNLLYFSSDGHAGFGLLDIFVSAPNTEGYQKPINIGLPVNSGYDDFSFYINEENSIGYMASNRPGGKGDDDIYRIKEIKDLPFITPVQTVEGIVSENDTGKPIAGASITVTGADSTTVNKIMTDRQGLYRLKVNAANTYVLQIEKSNYLKATDTLTLDDRRNVVNRKNFELTSYDQVDNDLVKVEEKLLIKVDNIYFDFDKWDIRDDAKTILNSVVQKMKQYPKMKITIGSHTDQRGTDAYNDQLSEKRANSTRNYIISQGITPDRVSAKGYGKRRPLIGCEENNCSQEQHELNRRSEFVILNVE
ncbi:OmpA family protein [Ascidiimonas aurantiaca]|uniref:OmpA family protein n=1 Tax=Ascidiimonas aurantiaca TaxID=1685432 RepID=UPI0030EB6716